LAVKELVELKVVVTTDMSRLQTLEQRLNRPVTISPQVDAANAIRQWNDLGVRLSRGVRPRIDERDLYHFNDHIKLKVRDWGMLKTAVEKPITPRINYNEIKIYPLKIPVYIDPSEYEKALRNIKTDSGLSVMLAGGTIQLAFNSKQLQNTIEQAIRASKQERFDLGKVISGGLLAPFKALMGVGKATGGLVTDALLLPFKLGANMLVSTVDNLFTGFTEEIGRAFANAPAKAARNTSNAISDTAGDTYSTLIGNKAAAVFISELLRSGSVGKAQQAASSQTNIAKMIEDFGTLSVLKSMPGRNTQQIMQEVAPDVYAKVMARVQSAPSDGKQFSSMNAKFQREMLGLATEIQQKHGDIVERFLGDNLQRFGGSIGEFIGTMQTYRTVLEAESRQFGAAELFPIKDEFGKVVDSILYVIGGAQFAEGEGGRALAARLEAIFPKSRVVPVQNFDTDNAPGSIEKSWLLNIVAKQFEKLGGVFSNPEIRNTAINGIRQFAQALDPTFVSEAAANTLANMLAANQLGISDAQQGATSYSLGGADLIKLARALEYLGKQIPTLAQAYPSLGLTNETFSGQFKSVLAQNDPLNFPYDTRATRAPSYHTRLSGTGNVGGMEAHADKHLYKSVDFLKILGEHFAKLNPALGDLTTTTAEAISKFQNLFGSRVYEALGALDQLKSIQETGEFNTASPFRVFSNSETSVVDLISTVVESAVRMSQLKPEYNKLPAPMVSQVDKTLALIKPTLDSLIAVFSKKGLVSENASYADLLGAIKLIQQGQERNREIDVFLGAIDRMSEEGQKAWFAGGGIKGADSQAAVRERIAGAREGAAYFNTLPAAEAGEQIKTAYKVLIEAMQDYYQLGDISEQTRTKLQAARLPEIGTDLAILAKSMNAMQLPGQEDLRRFSAPVPDFVYEQKGSVSAYNAILKDMGEGTSAILPPMTEFVKAAHGMSGAVALLTDTLVFKTDLIDKSKVASKQEVKAYEKLQGRYSPQMLAHEEGKYLVTERMQGMPLKAILDEEVAEAKAIQKHIATITEQIKQARGEGNKAKVEELQKALQPLRAQFRAAKLAFNEFITPLYEGVGQLGRVLQDLGVAHNDLASSNVFITPEGLQQLEEIKSLRSQMRQAQGTENFSQVRNAYRDALKAFKFDNSFAAIDLGNTTTDPETLAKLGDITTTIQRAIIDRSYWGLLSGVQQMGAIAKGYNTKTSNIAPARPVTSMPVYYQENKEVPIGVSEANLVESVIGSVSELADEAIAATKQSLAKLKEVVADVSAVKTEAKEVAAKQVSETKQIIRLATELAERFTTLSDVVAQVAQRLNNDLGGQAPDSGSRSGKDFGGIVPIEPRPPSPKGGGGGSSISIAVHDFTRSMERVGSDLEFVTTKATEFATPAIANIMRYVVAPANEAKKHARDALVSMTPGGEITVGLAESLGLPITAMTALASVSPQAAEGLRLVAAQVTDIASLVTSAGVSNLLPEGVVSFLVGVQDVAGGIGSLLQHIPGLGDALTKLGLTVNDLLLDVTAWNVAKTGGGFANRMLVPRTIRKDPFQEYEMGLPSGSLETLRNQERKMKSAHPQTTGFHTTAKVDDPAKYTLDLAVAKKHINDEIRKTEDKATQLITAIRAIKAESSIAEYIEVFTAIQEYTQQFEHQKDFVKKQAARLAETNVIGYKEQQSLVGQQKPTGDLNAKIKRLIPGFVRMGEFAAEGFNSGVDSSLDKTLESFASLISAIKRLYGISSPSRVFMKLGEDTGEGFVSGAEAKLRTLDETFGGLVKNAVFKSSAQLSLAVKPLADRVALESGANEGYLDSTKMRMAHLSGGTGGFYDPDTDSVVVNATQAVAAKYGVAMNKFIETLSHELRHAMQFLNGSNFEWRGQPTDAATLQRVDYSIAHIRPENKDLYRRMEWDAYSYGQEFSKSKQDIYKHDFVSPTINKELQQFFLDLRLGVQNAAKGGYEFTQSSRQFIQQLKQLSTVTDDVRNDFLTLTEAIQLYNPNPEEGAKNVKTAAYSALVPKDASVEAKSIAANIAAGVAVGMEQIDSEPWLRPFKEYITSVNKLFGIASPSRLMMKLAGFVMQGFAKGVIKEEDAVASAFKQTFANASKIVSGIDFSGIGSDIAQTISKELSASKGAQPSFLQERLPELQAAINSELAAASEMAAILDDMGSSEGLQLLKAELTTILPAYRQLEQEMSRVAIKSEDSLTPLLSTINRQQGARRGGAFSEGLPNVDAAGSLGEEIANKMRDAGKASEAAIANMSAAIPVLQRLKDAAVAFGVPIVGTIADGITSMADKFGILKAAGTGAFALVGLAVGAYTFAQAGVAQELVAIQLKFESVGKVGSASLKSVQDMAQRTGTDFRQMADLASGVQGALLGTSLETEALNISEKIGMINQALQLTPDQAQRFETALTQMFAKGIVSMEELRQQAAEAVPAIMPAFVKATGTSQAALIQKISAGELSSYEAVPKALDELLKMSSGSYEQGLQNFPASMNRISNSMLEINAAFGAFPLGVINNITRTFSDLLQSTTPLIKAVAPLAGIFATLGALQATALVMNTGVIKAALASTVGALDLFTKATTASLTKPLGAVLGIQSVARGGLLSVLMGAPVGAVVAGVVAVGAAIYGLNHHLTTYQKKLQNMRELGSLLKVLPKPEDSLKEEASKAIKKETASPQSSNPISAFLDILPQTLNTGKARLFEMELSNLLELRDKLTNKTANPLEQLKFNFEYDGSFAKLNADITKTTAELNNVKNGIDALPTSGMNEELELQYGKDAVAGFKAITDATSAIGAMSQQQLQEYAGNINGIASQIAALENQIVLEGANSSPNKSKIADYEQQIAELKTQRKSLDIGTLKGGSLENLQQIEKDLQDKIQEALKLDQKDLAATLGNYLTNVQQAIAKIQKGLDAKPLKIRLAIEEGKYLDNTQILEKQYNNALAKIATARSKFAITQEQAGLEEAKMEKINADKKLGYLSDYITKRYAVLKQDPGAAGLGSALGISKIEFDKTGFETAGLEQINGLIANIESGGTSAEKFKAQLEVLKELKQALVEKSQAHLESARAAQREAEANLTYMMSLRDVANMLDKVNAAKEAANFNLQVAQATSRIGLGSQLQSGQISGAKFDQLSQNLPIKQLAEQMRMNNIAIGNYTQAIMQLSDDERQSARDKFGISDIRQATMSQVSSALADISNAQAENKPLVNANVRDALSARKQQLELGLENLNVENQRIDAMRQSMVEVTASQIRQFQNSLQDFNESVRDYFQSLTDRIQDTQFEIQTINMQAKVLGAKNDIKAAMLGVTQSFDREVMEALMNALTGILDIFNDNSLRENERAIRTLQQDYVKTMRGFQNTMLDQQDQLRQMAGEPEQSFRVGSTTEDYATRAQNLQNILGQNIVNPLQQAGQYLQQGLVTSTGSMVSAVSNSATALQELQAKWGPAQSSTSSTSLRQVPASGPVFGPPPTSAGLPNNSYAVPNSNGTNKVLSAIAWNSEQERVLRAQYELLAAKAKAGKATQQELGAAASIWMAFTSGNKGLDKNMAALYKFNQLVGTKFEMPRYNKGKFSEAFIAATAGSSQTLITGPMQQQTSKIGVGTAKSVHDIYAGNIILPPKLSNEQVKAHAANAVNTISTGVGEVFSTGFGQMAYDVTGAANELTALMQTKGAAITRLNKEKIRELVLTAEDSITQIVQKIPETIANLRSGMRQLRNAIIDFGQMFKTLSFAEEQGNRRREIEDRYQGNIENINTQQRTLGQMKGFDTMQEEMVTKLIKELAGAGTTPEQQADAKKVSEKLNNLWEVYLKNGDRMQLNTAITETINDLKVQEIANLQAYNAALAQEAEYSRKEQMRRRADVAGQLGSKFDSVAQMMPIADIDKQFVSAQVKYNNAVARMAVDLEDYKDALRAANIEGPAFDEQVKAFEKLQNIELSNLKDQLDVLRTHMRDTLKSGLEDSFNGILDGILEGNLDLKQIGLNLAKSILKGFAQPGINVLSTGLSNLLTTGKWNAKGGGVKALESPLAALKGASRMTTASMEVQAAVVNVNGPQSALGDVFNEDGMFGSGGFGGLDSILGASDFSLGSASGIGSLFADLQPFMGLLPQLSTGFDSLYGGMNQVSFSAIPNMLQGLLSLISGMGGAGGAGGGGLGFLSLFTGGMFAEGGTVEAALQTEQARSGHQPLLAIVHKDEEVLSTKNHEAQTFRDLKKSGAWNLIREGKSYAYGGRIGATNKSLTDNISRRNNSSNNVKIGDTHIIVQGVHSPSQFTRSQTQLTNASILRQRKASPRLTNG